MNQYVQHYALLVYYIKLKNCIIMLVDLILIITWTIENYLAIIVINVDLMALNKFILKYIFKYCIYH